jgi:hypothetical protein
MLSHRRIEFYRRHGEGASIVERKMISRYIVTAPRICHGKPTLLAFGYCYDPLSGGQCGIIPAGALPIS